MDVTADAMMADPSLIIRRLDDDPEAMRLVQEVVAQLAEREKARRRERVQRFARKSAQSRKRR